MNDSELRRIAKERVEFKEHLYVYIVINVFLFIINMWFSPGVWWILFVTIFWGIGLAFHYKEAYFGSKQRNIEREYQKLKLMQKKKK